VHAVAGMEFAGSSNKREEQWVCVRSRNSRSNLAEASSIYYQVMEDVGINPRPSRLQPHVPEKSELLLQVRHPFQLTKNKHTWDMALSSARLDHETRRARAQRDEARWAAEEEERA